MMVSFWLNAGNTLPGSGIAFNVIGAETIRRMTTRRRKFVTKIDNYGALTQSTLLLARHEFTL